jgi:MFS family permease
LRDLDQINPPFARPNKAFLLNSIIPFFIGLGAWGSAVGVGVGIEFENNYLAILGVGMVIFSVLFLPIPIIFKWDWKSVYFGWSIYSVGSFAGMGLFPLLSILIYGALSFSVNMALLLFNILLIFWWCGRFVSVYKKIYKNEIYRNSVYVEEVDAFYYLQKVDASILEKKLKFKQFPSAIYVIISFFLALMLIPFMADVRNIVGAPFPLIFVSVMFIPINLMCLGLATRGFLIYYYYPRKIKLETGKDVYVDMVSKK